MRQTKRGTFAHPEQEGTQYCVPFCRLHLSRGWGERGAYDFGAEHLGDQRVHVKSTIFSEALVSYPLRN